MRPDYNLIAGRNADRLALSRTGRDLTWIHLAFLFAVTVMPFSTGLMAEFIHYRTALVIY